MTFTAIGSPPGPISRKNSISGTSMRVPKRISLILAVLTYRSIYGTSPIYLQLCFTRVADMISRGRLRSSVCHRLEYCTLDSLQSATGVPSCRRQHVERASVPHHIYTVTRGLQTASQDFPLPSFLYTRTS